ncbi:MAG: putative O-glycosylation ligase, exosortase A system-associated [Planctomycetota bacterium]|jgi:probable O-glycosylation ligase (exosortase A-associated)
MRDLLVSLALFSLFPVAFRRPLVGLIVFSWLAYMRVQDLTWGFARSFRWSFFMALTMFAGYLVQSSKERSRLFRPDIRCTIMLGMVLMVGLSVLFTERLPGSIDLETQVKRYVEFCKIITIALFTTGIIRTKEHMRLLVWIIALSLGFYGVKNGVWGIMTLARTPIIQGPGGLLFDNNDFSLALAMAVPMLWNIGMSERREVLRRAFLAMVPLTAFTVLLTHSRGGLLSLAGAVGVLVWRSKYRGRAIALSIVLGIAAIPMLPSEMRDRFASIADYKNDGSANARFRSWAVAVNMATSNPFLGVGMSNFRGSYLRYQPNPTAQELAGQDIYVAHNSYLQIWAETGTPALLLYLSMILVSLITTWRVRAKARLRYRESWIINYATMFEASLVAFMIGSTFLNRAHFDLFYHWVAVVLLFGVFAEEQMREDDARGGVEEATEGRSELRQVGSSGFDSVPRSIGFRNTDLSGGRA